MTCRTIMRLTLPFVLLAGGCAVYLTYRQEIAGLGFMQGSALLEAVKADRGTLAGSAVGRFILFTLPDMLWFAALLTLQTAVAMPRNRPGTIVLLLSAATPFAWEFLQLSGLIAGTFDTVDLAGYSLTLIIIILCQRKRLSELLRNA